jgi:hypothetical protein
MEKIGIPFGVRMKICLTLGLILSLVSCSEEALEDRADRSDVFEFSSAEAEFSVVPEASGLFSLKKKILRKGGILIQQDRLLCILVRDKKIGSLSFQRNISAQFDLWIHNHNVKMVKIWVNGVPNTMDIFALDSRTIVDSKKLGDRLRDSFGDGGEGWAPMTIPFSALDRPIPDSFWEKW